MWASTTALRRAREFRPFKCVNEGHELVVRKKQLAGTTLLSSPVERGIAGPQFGRRLRGRVVTTTSFGSESPADSRRCAVARRSEEVGRLTGALY
jgi:hypothetical protein